jgi:hypothetical protein
MPKRKRSDEEHVKVVMERFPSHRMRKFCSIFITGKHGCGKTTLVFDLMSNFANSFDFGLVMTKNKDVADEARNIMPKAYVYETYEQKVVDKFVELAEKFEQMNEYKRFFLVLDDCLDEKGVLKRQAYRTIVMRGRHIHMMVMVIAHNCMDAPTDYRGEIDYAFSYYENSPKEMDKLYQNFYGTTGSFPAFRRIHEATTGQNYRALVNDIKAHGKLYWYTATFPLPPPNQRRMLRARYYKMSDMTEIKVKQQTMDDILKKSLAEPVEEEVPKSKKRKASKASAPAAKRRKTSKSPKPTTVTIPAAGGAASTMPMMFPGGSAAPTMTKPPASKRRKLSNLAGKDVEEVVFI